MMKKLTLPLLAVLALSLAAVGCNKAAEPEADVAATTPPPPPPPEPAAAEPAAAQPEADIKPEQAEAAAKDLEKEIKEDAEAEGTK
jgi:hypothetical protein